MVLLVSYDLKKPGKDYSDLYQTLKKAKKWWHYLDSTWLLVTDLSPKAWLEKIKPAIDENDFVLIIQVTNNYSGWLPKEAWEWIRDNI